jgi:hypothetical protein
MLVDPIARVEDAFVAIATYRRTRFKLRGCPAREMLITDQVVPKERII